MVQPGMGQNGPPGTYNNQGPLPSPGNTDEYHEKLKQLRKYIEPMSRVSLETIIVFHYFFASHPYPYNFRLLRNESKKQIAIQIHKIHKK